MQSVLDLLKEYQSYGLLALVVTVFATPLAAQIAKRLGAMDRPDQHLKPHARPIPYLGGAAICLGWSAALLLAILSDSPEIDQHMLLPILLGGIAMSALGLLDDLREVPPKLRLAAGALIIMLVMLWTGVGFDASKSFTAPLHIDLPAGFAMLVSFLIGLVIVLGACNSTNLIDGLDGLCAGVTAIICLGFFVLAAHLALWQYSREGNTTRLILSIAMFGATLGFLPLNFNPAKIFMGDAGSVLLGFNCGVLILMFGERGQIRWLLGGLMVFALPIFDTALAIVRRWRSGRSIFAGDRSHFYDQLVDRGMSVRKVVFISYALAAFYAALGCASIWVRLRYTIPLYTVVVLATATVILRTGMARAEPPPTTDSADSAPEACD
ncbi:MAG: undecaprenyl/decaprenyl-phosphate alpha-N-acetylglucosaminyl 1-phosphate transferase [Planctomycetes bacterium]|nr:undecaprenyl/decaprenyl-phosphate alpha-N-acetylglucosaminyl 1-phosphate transferase [Planctomycetota bacterium]